MLKVAGIGFIGSDGFWIRPLRYHERGPGRAGRSTRVVWGRLGVVVWKREVCRPIGTGSRVALEPELITLSPGFSLFLSRSSSSSPCRRRPCD